MSRRYYSNTAIKSYITASLNGVDTSSTFSVSATSGGATAPPTGWPAVPFFAAINRGASDEEVVLVTAVTGSSVTATRGSTLASPYGSTTQSHSINATIEHVATAADYDEANDHVNDSTAVHGTTGSVVGTGGAQTLTDKTLTAPVLTAPVIADFTSAAHDHGDADDGGNIPQASVTDLETALAAKDTALTNHGNDTSTHGVATVAGLTEAQTMTNKTLTAPNINAAAVDGAVVFAAGGTIDVPTQAPVQSQENTNTTTTASAYQNTGTPVTATVVAPPSGSIRVDLFARMYAEGGETVWLAFECRETDDAGSVVLAEANARAMQVYGANPQSVAFTYIVDGLTPGGTYYFRLKHKVSNGTGTYVNRVLIVTPTLG